MLLSRAFQQPEPVFQAVVVSPAKPPPASAVDNNQPFFQAQPTNQLTTIQPTSSQATLHQQPAHQPKSDNWPSTTTTHQQLTNQPATLQQQPT